MLKLMKRLAKFMILALAATVVCPPLLAQTYPAKPVRILVGFAPGGSTDIVARLIAQELAADLGRSVMVENKPGAGGRIAAESAASSAPDGHTLLLGTAGTVVQLATGEKLSFDLFKDLTPIVRLAENAHVLVVHPSIPAHTVSEFAALAKSRADLAYASAGEYTSLHIAGALFGAVAKANLLHIPYKSGGVALTDLVTGRVQMMFADLPTILPRIKSGDLRALAVTGEKRSPLLPDVPTMRESGFDAIDTSSWFGLMAPAGTPTAIVEQLNSRINAILLRDAARAKFAELGLTPTGGTPAQYASFLRNNVGFWKRAVALSGTRVQ